MREYYQRLDYRWPAWRPRRLHNQLVYIAKSLSTRPRESDRQRGPTRSRPRHEHYRLTRGARRSSRIRSHRQLRRRRPLRHRVLDCGVQFHQSYRPCSGRLLEAPRFRVLAPTNSLGKHFRRGARVPVICAIQRYPTVRNHQRP